MSRGTASGHGGLEGQWEKRLLSFFLLMVGSCPFDTGISGYMKLTVFS